MSTLLISGIEWAADAEAWFVEDVGVDPSSPRLRRDKSGWW